MRLVLVRVRQGAWLDRAGNSQLGGLMACRRGEEVSWRALGVRGAGRHWPEGLDRLRSTVYNASDDEGGSAVAKQERCVCYAGAADHSASALVCPL